jgi:molecular chaperone DnaK (HSP70)
MAIGFDFGTSNTVWCHAIPGGQALTVARRFLSKEVVEGDPAEWIASLAAYQGQQFFKAGAYVRRHAEQLQAEGCRLIRSSKTRLLKQGDSELLVGNPWSSLPEGDAAKEIVKHALAVQGHGIRSLSEERAVLTHPFGANAVYRRGLRKSLEDLGLRIAYYLCEPTAALLSFSQVRLSARDSDARHFLVFDWGGGTLDVSVVRVGGGKFLEVAKKGVPIAGDRIDEIILEDMKEQGAKVAEGDRSIADALWRDAEVLKIRLCSTGKDVERRLRDSANTRYILTVERFRKLLEKDVLPRVIETVGEALGALRDDQIDEVFMVGGSSNVPMIREEMERKFPGRVTWHRQMEDGQSAIAEGAAAALAMGAQPFLAWGLNTWAPNGAVCPLIEPGRKWDDVVGGHPVRARFFLTDLDAEQICIPLGYQVDSPGKGVNEAHLLKTLLLPRPNMAKVRGCWEPLSLDIRGESDGTLTVSAGLDGPNFPRASVQITDAPWGLQLP